MLRAFAYLILIGIIGGAAAWIASTPSSVTLEWLGYRVDTSIGILIGFMVLVGIAFYFALRFWIGVRTAPKRTRRAYGEWRRRRGYRALTQGMVAVAAGDATEARRLARKAENLLADPPLTMLLSAQAAQLSGDEKAAGQFFDAMSERTDTKYLGVSGKLKQAMQEGDSEGALELAEQAAELNPKADAVSSTLFELQVKNKNWADAQETTKQAVRNKITDVEAGKRRRAILEFQRSVESEAEGDLGEALSLARRAE